MRWSSLLGSVGVVSLNLVGMATADSLPTPPATTSNPPVVVYPGNSGCYTPGMPITPGSPYSPGTVMPGTVSPTQPGMPSTTQPGAMPGMSPFAAAPSAAAAAAIASATPGQTSSAGQAVGETGSASLASRAPQIIGDLVGGGLGSVLSRPSSSSSFNSYYPYYPSNSSSYRSHEVIAGRGSFKIGENENVLPTDRVFTTFNYFNGAGRDNNPGGGGDIYRNMFGFEKTFLDGAASFGIRSGYQAGTGNIRGLDGLSSTTFIMKYAFLPAKDSGVGITGGLAVTAPWGEQPILADGKRLDSTLIQPYLGYILAGESAYLLGFNSVIIPTDSRDVTLWASDFALGYRLLNADEGVVTQIIPTLEGHFNTALSSNNRDRLVYFPDQFTVTGGVHIGLFNRSFLTVACGVPVAGPRLNIYEVVTQFNWRF